MFRAGPTHAGSGGGTVTLSRRASIRAAPESTSIVDETNRAYFLRAVRVRKYATKALASSAVRLALPPLGGIAMGEPLVW